MLHRDYEEIFEDQLAVSLVALVLMHSDRSEFSFRVSQYIRLVNRRKLSRNIWQYSRYARSDPKEFYDSIFKLVDEVQEVVASGRAAGKAMELAAVQVPALDDEDADLFWPPAGFNEELPSRVPSPSSSQMSPSHSPEREEMDADEGEDEDNAHAEWDGPLGEVYENVQFDILFTEL